MQNILNKYSLHLIGSFCGDWDRPLRRQRNPAVARPAVNSHGSSTSP
jgi:hypothetical protein